MQLVLTILVLIVFLSTLAQGAPHTLVLTDEQEMALSYATERMNIDLAGRKDSAGNPLPILTADQVLSRSVTRYLTNELRNLDAGLAPVLENLKALDAATLAKVLATVSSQATRDRIQQKLAP